MAPRSNPDDVLLATGRIIAEYGDVRSAARQMGISSSTIQDRFTQIRERWPDWFAPAMGMPGWALGTPLAPPSYVAPRLDDYTPPQLPSEDINLDELISQMEAEQERQKTHRSAAEWMKFHVNGTEPFALAFVGDPHLDTCDIARLRGHLDLIEATPRMWAVGLGDWLNSWVGRLKGQYGLQAVTERQGLMLAQWVLKRDIWWLLLLGNHDGERWHGHGNPLRWMETACPVPVQEWQAKFSIACGDATWKIWAAHNFPGNSQFNANHGPDKRALHTGAMADLYIAGDRHTFKLSQDQHEHTGRVFWSARARGYKPLDTYALEKGHGSAGGEAGIGHSIGAVFDPRDGSLVCFADLHKAASYLRSLKPRISVRAV